MLSRPARPIRTLHSDGLVKPVAKCLSGLKHCQTVSYKLLSTFGFNFNVRRYTMATHGEPPTLPNGRAVQVDPIKPALKAPGINRLKLK